MIVEKKNLPFFVLICSNQDLANFKGRQMKGRHQFRRRFSLQPSFLKEEPEEERHHHAPR